ncbi:MAG: (2Fe-2S)-binding protein [Xanthomonadales bacterium]|nr:(2Fe-2S)-binding protein [Xanthomonadales bacterium]
MYICICNAVNESAIKAAAANGVSTLRELSLATGLATACGKCATEAVRILEQANADTTVVGSMVNSDISRERLSIPVLTVVA